MKGIFIPDITAEMFRNGCLKSIETLMAEGEVYDIEYGPKSAQPDLQPTCNQLAKDTNTPCKDTISRQDAIIAVRSHRIDIDDPKKIVRKSYEDVIRELPPAEPEIIRCNSCKHWTQSTGKMKGYGLGRCDFLDADLVTCSGFCYWAERREDVGESDKDNM